MFKLCGWHANYLKLLLKSIVASNMMFFNYTFRPQLHISTLSSCNESNFTFTVYLPGIHCAPTWWFESCPVHYITTTGGLAYIYIYMGSRVFRRDKTSESKTRRVFHENISEICSVDRLEKQKLLTAAHISKLRLISPYRWLNMARINPIRFIYSRLIYNKQTDTSHVA